MHAYFKKYFLKFIFPAGTSRGTLYNKVSYFLILEDNHNKGIGECSLIPNLSPDNVESFEDTLNKLCKNIIKNKNLENLESYPAIQFGYEMAKLSLEKKSQVLFPSNFVKGINGIPINGLIWMGSIEFMQKQIQKKISDNYACLKLKIGSLKWQDELNLLKTIRKKFSVNSLEIRVDANGAFNKKEAPEKMDQLLKLDIHSIEQPIEIGNWEMMHFLCNNCELPVALDEELIGKHKLSKKRELLSTLKPQYIILKPSLLGGFGQSHQWIDIARENNINWWVTSALESNIGLSAISQWVYKLKNPLMQGLGTGKLFLNNIPSPLYESEGYLYYQPSKQWEWSSLL